MKINEANYLNSTEKTQDSNQPSTNPFFSDEGISDTPTNASNDIVKRRLIIFEYIKNHPNSSCYQIAKRLKIGYATAHAALREIVFARMVYVKQALDSQGRPIEVFFLPEEEGAGK